MNVIGYARLSSAREESTSIERQRELIAAHAAAKGWTLLETIEDPSASASKLRLNRPGLTRARRYLASGQAEAVLVWRLDRIARSVVDFGTLLDEGMAIVSCTEPLDTTTPMGRAMAEILQVFAAMEARAISARVSMSVDYLRRNERYPGGKLPYGYRPAPHPSGTGRALEIDPAEGAIVAEAVRRVLAGESVYAVAMDLNARGVPTKTGVSGWSVQALQGVLLGDAILGRVRSRGELVIGPDGLPLPVWPPIVTVSDSLALRRLLSPQRGTEGRRKASRLLSGVIVCHACGRNMLVQRRRTPSRRPGGPVLEATAYRCASKGSGHACPQPVAIEAERTERYVVDQFLAVIGHWPVVEEILTTPLAVGVAEVEDAIQTTTAAMAERGADIPALAARLTSLQARREELEAVAQLPESTMVETGRTFAEEWAARAGDVAAQRRLLQSAISEVVITPSETPRKWNADRINPIWLH